MTFTVKTQYQGYLRQQNTHLPSGETLLTDGPQAAGGKDVSMQDFRVTQIHIVFHLNAAFAPELRQELEAATREMCIVGRSLHPDLKQEFEFVYA